MKTAVFTIQSRSLGAHEDLLFKESFMRIQIQTFRHLDVKRVILMSPLLKQWVLNTLSER